jgi:hypothetical protein
MGRELLKGVSPADLGEMAANVEMQKAYIGKKQPRSLSFQEIKSDHYCSMLILTDIDLLSDEESLSAILPTNAADIPLQAVRLVEETLWNCPRGVYQDNMRP